MAHLTSAVSFSYHYPPHLRLYFDSAAPFKAILRLALAPEYNIEHRNIATMLLPVFRVIGLATLHELPAYVQLTDTQYENIIASNTEHGLTYIDEDQDTIYVGSADELSDRVHETQCPTPLPRNKLRLLPRAGY